MSDSLIAFQPAIEEPSNQVAYSNRSSSTMVTSKVTCCSLPRMSVKRRSRYLMSSSLICLRMSAAVVIEVPCSILGLGLGVRALLSERVVAEFAGTDADGLLDRVD